MNRIAKYAFRRLSKILIYRKISLLKKEKVMNGYVIYILLYGSEYWTIVEVTGVVSRRMQRISWNEH